MFFLGDYFLLWWLHLDSYHTQWEHLKPFFSIITLYFSLLIFLLRIGANFRPNAPTSFRFLVAE